MWSRVSCWCSVMGSSVGAGCYRMEGPACPHLRPGASIRCGAHPPVGLDRLADLGSTTMRLAVIPGDGIGPEVIAEALKVLGEVAPTSRRTPVRPRRGPLAARPASRCPTRCSTSCASTTRSCSAPSATRPCRSGILERGLLLRLRFELDHHVNLRPARLFPACPARWPAPGPIDMSRARGHRGSLRRQRRRPPAGHPARDRDRGQHQHRVRRGARRPVRLRAGRRPAAQAPDADPQDQRAHPRRRPVVSDGGGGRLEFPRSPWPTSTWTPPRCSSSPTRAATT